ncbi:ATP-binding protein [Williamsia limnetica]|nr:ATP-binding protein [Williamsia limnetica]
MRKVSVVDDKVAAAWAPMTTIERSAPTDRTRPKTADASTVARSLTVTVVGNENLERILRMLARLVSVGYLVYFVVLLPPIMVKSARLDAWWTPLAVATVFGFGLLPGMLSFRSDTRPMRLCAAAAAVAFLLAIVTWPLAWKGPDLAASDAFWLAAFPGLASLAAIVAWPIWLTATHLVSGCVGVMAITAVARGGSSISMLPTEIAFTIMFCTLFVGGAAMAIRTGKLLDFTTESTHRAAASAAAQRARTVERKRIDALIHDNVLSALLAAARGQPEFLVGPLARSALAGLDPLSTQNEPNRLFAVEEAIAHLRAAAADADEQATFDIFSDDIAGLDKLAADGIRTIGSAIAEALRNSRLHAGDSAMRAVTVHLTEHVLKIDVIDDGIGFDPTSIAPHRLGIAVSIVGRMRGLPGGSASVQSRHGVGTLIHLEWALQ